jgi:hypothetical protein
VPKSIAALAALCALLPALNSCGEDPSPLASEDPTAAEIVDMWKTAVCDGHGEFTPATSPGLYGEIDGATCILDANGSLSERRQVLWVFDSPEAADTFVATSNCAEYTYVHGRNWASSVTYLDLATALVKAGGTICK